MNLGKFEEARENYKKTLEHEEPSPETLCCLAASYEKMNMYELAIGYYKKAVKLDSLWDEGWFGIGVCLDAQEKWFEALHFLRKALNLNQESAEYWLTVADTEAKIGNSISSLEAYQQSSELDPSNPEVWLRWSLLLYEQGDYDKAVEIILTGMDELPEEADLYYRVTAYLLSVGSYKEAFVYLENALLLNYEKHTVLFEFFPQVETQKALYKIIEQYRK